MTGLRCGGCSARVWGTLAEPGASWTSSRVCGGGCCSPLEHEAASGDLRELAAFGLQSDDVAQLRVRSAVLVQLPAPPAHAVGAGGGWTCGRRRVVCG